MSIENYRQNQPQRWARADDLWGSGATGMAKLFGHGGIAGVPFPQSSRSANRRAHFDHGAIEHALAQGDLVDIDPRTLLGMQSHITRPGVEHYLGPEYEQTGRTFASPDRGNAFPVVYEANNPHFGWTERNLMGGHHRATSSLLQGVPLRGVLVRAPYLR